MTHSDDTQGPESRGRAGGRPPEHPAHVEVRVEGLGGVHASCQVLFEVGDPLGTDWETVAPSRDLPIGLHRIPTPRFEPAQRLRIRLLPPGAGRTRSP
jgi:hypothetical protein